MRASQKQRRACSGRTVSLALPMLAVAVWSLTAKERRVEALVCAAKRHACSGSSLLVVTDAISVTYVSKLYRSDDFARISLMIRACFIAHVR